jgi:hypothetical protein
MIGKAFWLAVCSLNFYYFTQNAYLGTSVFWQGQTVSRIIWASIAYLVGKMLYREIRRATRED